MAVASLEATLHVEPAINRLIGALLTASANNCQVTTVNISAKGLRLMTSYLGTAQVQVYLPEAAFRHYSWTSPETERIACNVASLLESLHLCTGKSQSKQATNDVSLRWSANSDFVTIKSTEAASFEVTIQLPTEVPPEWPLLAFSSPQAQFQIIMAGPAVRELLGDLFAGNHFSTISVECDPDAHIILIASHYSGGSMEICHSLHWNTLEQVKCSEPFKASYELSRLKPLLTLSDASKSAALRVNGDRILSIQLMVPLNSGSSYAEFLGTALAMTKTPAEFLKTVIGHPVEVRLHSDIQYRGVLVCLDGYMNIALEDAREYSRGALKHSYGDIFIRGNNVLYIRAASGSS